MDDPFPPAELTRLYHEALEAYRAHRTEEAKEKLLVVIDADPSYEDAYEALSVIYYNQKSYDQAVTLIKEWLAVNPGSIMAHTNLSRCYVAKGMILEAEHEQAEARRLTWKTELKAKKQEMPKIDFEEKISRFKKVIEFDPKDVLGYYSLASVYLEMDRKREAVDTFEKGLEVDPNHSSSYLGLGLALEGLGDKEKAGKIYQKGIKVADERGDVMTQRKMESRIRALKPDLK